MSCDPYITCLNTDLALESLLRMLMVEGDDGELYLKVNTCNGGGGGSGSLCIKDGTFTNADLVANKLEINHACASTAVLYCNIIDPSGTFELNTPTLGKADGTDTLNYVTVDFGAPIGAGTFQWVLAASV